MRIAVILLILLLSPAFASEIVWSESGANLATSEEHSTKAWFSKGINVQKTEDDGLLFASRATKYLTMLPDYYVVFDLYKAKHTSGTHKKYHAWSIHFAEVGKIAGNVTHAPEGLYTVKLSDLSKKTWSSATLYNYNMDLYFRFIRLEKSPENLLEIELPDNTQTLKEGDTVRILLKLKDPCEDVVCKWMIDQGTGPGPFSVNGTDTIELQPIDDDCKVWAATVTFKSFKRDRKIFKRQVMVKTTVLGGSLQTPLYTYMAASLRQEPEPSK
jgi:hypothetical protein